MDTVYHNFLFTSTLLKCESKILFKIKNRIKMHTFIPCHPHVTNALSFCLNELPHFKKMCYLIPKERRFYENMKNSFSFLAKHISWKYIVLILILIYIILLTVPYLPHKTVSEEYKEKDAAAEYYSDTSGTERIAYITDNNDALLYRLGMIEEAEKSIILSTFDFNDDEAGQDILSALLNAADRGVDIRVIVDGISGFMDVQHNPWFLALDAHKNAQVRIYNPVQRFWAHCCPACWPPA